jgi:hypothetical protein
VIAALVIVFAVLGCGYLFAVMCIPIEPRPKDRLSNVIAMWLADERPAWETIEAFERDVERVLRGIPSRPHGGPRRPSPDLDELQRALLAVYRVPPHDLRPVIMEDGWSSVRHTSQGTVYKT